MLQGGGRVGDVLGGDFVLRGPNPFSNCHVSDITWLSHVVQIGLKNVCAAWYMSHSVCISMRKRPPTFTFHCWASKVMHFLKLSKKEQKRRAVVASAIINALSSSFA